VIPDYERVEKAIRYLLENHLEQPQLDDVAAAAGLSPHHLQRVFKRWAGVSPKRFLQFLTVEHAKRLLEESQSVLDAAFETGLSSPGRLHDHFVALEAVTPGQYKERGHGLSIRHGVHPSPFGTVFLAVTDRGICALSFLGGGDEEAGDRLTDLRRQWPEATFSTRRAETRALAERVFAAGPGDAEPIRLLVQGTNFQVQVWKALLRIPPGAVTSYERVAQAVGRPRAFRAVGTAVGQNPVSYLIPCHRVIRGLGLVGNYRWGEERKHALLAWEAARRNREAAAV
jgi:AraC family transcriptional regulator of adaptative response/methylated-DNA-[protein]-cysteine methyltransferase